MSVVAVVVVAAVFFFVTAAVADAVGDAVQKKLVDSPQQPK